MLKPRLSQRNDDDGDEPGEYAGHETVAGPEEERRQQPGCRVQLKPAEIGAGREEVRRGEGDEKQQRIADDLENSARVFCHQKSADGGRGEDFSMKVRSGDKRDAAECRDA